jgi:hypothetical protein
MQSTKVLKQNTKTYMKPEYVRVRKQLKFIDWDRIYFFVKPMSTGTEDVLEENMRICSKRVIFLDFL